MNQANAIRLKGQLRAQGCGVESSRQVGKTFLINIICPTADLKAKAVEVLETFGGIRRRAFVAKIDNSCWIIWR